MKTLYLIAMALAINCGACQHRKRQIEKTWQGHAIDFSQLQELTNTYYMYDSTGTKVGSMVFGFSFENGFLMARDTSRFDDGSVYETAAFTFDTANFQMAEVSMDMKTRRATLDIDLRKEDDKVKGTYILISDNSSRTFEIDTAYHFTNFRGEIYILTHALAMKQNDTISLRSLEPTSMAISEARLSYSRVETIETINGMEACDVLWLSADGKMPDNKLWVRQKSPRTIVKFYVPGPELNIVLEHQKNVAH